MRLLVVLLLLIFAPGAAIVVCGYIEDVAVLRHVGFGALGGAGWVLLINVATYAARQPS